MDVLALVKCPEQRGVFRQVRHDPQFDLRIIGRDEDVIGRRDEGLANAAALRGAHRDVLQVGIVRREPPGDGRSLGERGVHAARARIDHLRQLVRVRRLELRHRTMFEQDLGQWIVGRQLLQHFLVGGRLSGRGLLDHRQVHPLEQDFSQLLRRSEVERLPRELVRLLLQRHHPLAQFAALLREQVRVDEDAVAFHAEQHFAHRHLDLRVDVVELRVRGNRRMERAMQAQRHVGVLGGVFRRAVDGHLLERNALGALAGHVVVADRRQVQVTPREIVHVVRLVRLDHVGFEQRVVRDAAQSEDRRWRTHAGRTSCSVPASSSPDRRATAPAGAAWRRGRAGPARLRSGGQAGYSTRFRARSPAIRRRCALASDRGWWSPCPVRPNPPCRWLPASAPMRARRKPSRNAWRWAPRRGRPRKHPQRWCPSAAPQCPSPRVARWCPPHPARPPHPECRAASS